MAPPPVVTGISPKEGPPGTRVTLRGEFLGNKAQDLIGLSICGCDCLLSAEWKSPNKIIARSGPCKGRGDIIVTTRNGGQGSSTVQFRGYHETIGPMKESAVWVEEAPMQSLVWGRRTLSPTNYQQEDPLGLSVEGNEKKFPEDELIELFGDCSGELASERFNPGWFLLQHHHATTLDDLKAGLAYLRRKVHSQKEGQLSFLKANVGSVMEQLDTIMLLKEQFETDVQKQGTDPTIKLEKAIAESMSEADKLFHDILARRDKADATRNALSLMQRYRFLFCMPVNIEKNISRGNYDLVINDYARVKNLFGNTDLEVFKRVLNEIEARIDKLRVILRKKLEEMPVTLDEQKKIIRNLVNLEADGDPAWDAIVSYARHSEKSIAACMQEYLENENAGGADSNRIPKSNALTPSSMSFRQLRMQHTEESNIPSRVLCVEAICDVVTGQLPDLWRLGQSYFTGQLHVTVDTEKQGPFKKHELLCFAESIYQTAESILPKAGRSVLDVSISVTIKLIRNMINNKRKSWKKYGLSVLELLNLSMSNATDNTSRRTKQFIQSGNELAVLIDRNFRYGKFTSVTDNFKYLRIYSTFCKNLVLSSMEHAVSAMKTACSSNLDASWLLHNLRCIRQTYASLIHLDLPNEALDIFGKFLFDLRLQCLLALFKQTADKIANLHRKETWEIEYLNEHGGVTRLPGLFEEMVMEVAKLARETVLACGPREVPLLANIQHQNLFHNAVKTLFGTFAKCLQQLAFSGSEEAIENDESSVSQLIGSPAGYHMRTDKQQGPTWEQCLLISLSNIHYTLHTVIPRILEILKVHGYPPLALDMSSNSDWTQLETLDSAVLDAYLERRSDPLVGTIEPSMYLGGLEWHLDIEPMHVRPYLQEALTNLIAVHAEVRRVSPGLLKRILSHIVETVAEELARLMSCVTRFSQTGAIQARTDIKLLRNALRDYTTPRAGNFFEEALDVISYPESKADLDRSEALLVKITSSMQLQISCLTNRSVDAIIIGTSDLDRTTTV